MCCKFKLRKEKKMKSIKYAFGFILFINTSFNFAMEPHLSKLYRYRLFETEKYPNALRDFKAYLPKHGKVTFDNIWYAMYYGLEEAFGLLMTEAKNQNFDFNQKNEATYGPTLLYLAVKFHHLFAVSLLLEQKADPYIKTNEGLNAFDAAKEELQDMKALKDSIPSDTPRYEICLKISQLLEQAK